MIRDIALSIVVVAISLAVLISMATSVKACEDDKCSKRLAEYIGCITHHGDKMCRVHRKAANNACKSENQR